MDLSLRRTGYVLLALGIVIMLLAMGEMLLVFTSNLSPAQLFSFESRDFAIDGDVLFPQLPKQLTQDLEVELFPAELINTVLNLGANTILMSVIILAGSKIATIGVQLLRPVYVKMRTQDEQVRLQEKTNSGTI